MTDRCRSCGMELVHPAELDDGLCAVCARGDWEQQINLGLSPEEGRRALLEPPDSGETLEAIAAGEVVWFGDDDGQGFWGVEE